MNKTTFALVVFIVGVAAVIPQASTVTTITGLNCSPPASVYNSTDKKYYDCYDINKWGERLVAGDSLVALNNIKFPTCLDGQTLVYQSGSLVCGNGFIPTPAPTPIPTPTPTPTPILPVNYSIVVQLKINNFGFGFASVKITPSISNSFLAQSDAGGKISLSFTNVQTYKLNIAQPGYNCSPTEIDITNQSVNSLNLLFNCGNANYFPAGPIQTIP